MKRLSVALVASLVGFSTFACDKKYNNLYDWMGTVVTNPFKVDANNFCPAYTGRDNWSKCRKDSCNSSLHYIPMLALYPDHSIKTVWSLNASADSFSHLYKYQQDDLACKYILTNSLMFEPSGDKVYGLVVPREMRSDKDSYLQRVQCKIHDDGSIYQRDLQKIDDQTCENLTKGIGINWAFTCATDQDKKRFAIMLWQEDHQNSTFKVLIGDTAEKSFAYSNEINMGKIQWIDTQIFFGRHSTQRICINDMKKAFFLDYTLEPMCDSISCSAREIAVDVNNPDVQRTVSLNRTWTSVRDHILAWPVISAGLSDDTIKPPAQRVVHCYQEDPAWPREIFKNYFAHIWHITQIQGDKTYDKADEEYVFSCRLEDLVRFVQIMYLSKLSEVTTYCFAIQDRAVVKRSADATLAVDPEGELYHCPLDNNSKTYIDNVSTRLPFRLDIYQIWATYIARRDFPNMGAAQEYLQTHRCEALQVNTQEFFKFYTDHAKTYAQRTWDNGIIGVYWSFNKDGMHIRLYDLTKEQPEKIGDYMEGRHSEGIITSVEYTPGHEPIFHIKA